MYLEILVDFVFEICITLILILGILGGAPDNCAATTLVTGEDVAATTLDAGVKCAERIFDTSCFN